MSNIEEHDVVATLEVKTTEQGKQEAHLSFAEATVAKTIQVFNQKGEQEHAQLEYDEHDRLVGLRLSDKTENPPNIAKSSYGVSFTREEIGETSVAYIRITQCPPGGVSRTIIANDENMEELGVNLDIDADGHVLGIELMDGSQLPVDTEGAPR